MRDSGSIDIPERLRNLSEIHAENQTNGGGGGRSVGLRFSESAVNAHGHRAAARRFKPEGNADGPAVLHAIFKTC